MRENEITNEGHNGPLVAAKAVQELRVGFLCQPFTDGLPAEVDALVAEAMAHLNLAELRLKAAGYQLDRTRRLKAIRAELEAGS